CVDGKDAVNRALGPDERHAEIRLEAGGEERIGIREATVRRGVGDDLREARLEDVAGEDRRRRRTRADRVLGTPAARGGAHELALRVCPAPPRVGLERRRRVLDALVEDRIRVELGRERAPRPGELLREGARASLRLEDLAGGERAARGLRELPAE